MMRNVFIIPVIVLLVVLAVWVVLSLKKQNSGIKLMLLGISVILCGGIIAVDVNSSLGGLEYLFVLIGLVVSIAGFSKKE